MAANKKPTAKNYTRPTETDLANVPEELRETPQWECWKLVDERKIPIDATTGKAYPPGKQNSDKMGSATFWRACELLASRKDLQGVGFRFKKDDPYTGVDLDDVRDPATGELQPWARAAVSEFGTYAEISPSGTGLHIIGLAKLLKALTKTVHYAGHVEMYSVGRYFTITGQKLPDAPPDISNIQPQADRWYRLLTAKPAKNGDDPAAHAEVSVGTIPKGEQHWWLFRRASKYRAEGDSDQAIRDKLKVDYREHCAPPHDNEKHVLEIVENVCRSYKPGDAEAKTATPPPPPLVVMDINDYMVAQFPPRKVLLRLADGYTRILTAQSINQIFAWRGTGKSMLAEQLSVSIAAGEKFLVWEPPAPARVLYVEGEMPDDQGQERFRQLIAKKKIAPGFLRIITMGLQPDGITPLTSAVGQRALEDALGDTEVLILDSLSTLAWIATNDEDNWLEFLFWLNKLRHGKKLCIIFLHHAGKSGMQRGHSRSEDMLDLSLKLERDKDDETEWCKFRMTYDKVRGERTGVRNLDVEYCNGLWGFQTVEADRLAILEKYMETHPKAAARTIARDIGKELGITSHTAVLTLLDKWKASPDPTQSNPRESE
jgi:hypothetical protein